MLLAVLTAAVIVAGMRVVGLLLIAALMVLPVASAQLLARSFRATLRLSVAVGAASAFVGLVFGRLLHLAPGGAIVLVAAAIFAVVALGARAARSACSSSRRTHERGARASRTTSWTRGYAAPDSGTRPSVAA